MKVAVTGGSGFIGSRLVQKLSEKGYEVIIVDIKKPEKNVEDKNVEVKIVDVTNREETIKALKGCNLVFHLAGFVLGDMRKRPYEGTLLHVNGTLNVLEACRINSIDKIFYASSFYVYDGIDEKEIVNEETRLDIFKMELFGATKLMGEVLIREYSKKYGIKYVIYRFGSAYGPGKCTNVIKTFIEAGLRGEPIEVWGKGKRRNQYTFVDDLVNGCLLGMDEINETYNLISPEEKTTGQLAELLKKKYGFEVVYNPVHKEGPSMPYMSSRKAIKRLGWNPTPLEKGIEITYAALKEDKLKGA